MTSDDNLHNQIAPRIALQLMRSMYHAGMTGPQKLLVLESIVVAVLTNVIRADATPDAFDVLMKNVKTRLEEMLRKTPEWPTKDN